MIDITTEKLISLKEAVRLLPRVDGRTIALCGVWRWCMKGIGPEYIKLDHVRIGRRVCTSEEALHRFMHATAAAAIARLDGPPFVPSTPKFRPRTEKQRAKAIARAEASLKAAGFKS